MFFPCTGELREKQAATTHTGALHTRVARTHAAAQVSHQCYRRDKQGGVALVAAEVGKSAVGMRKRFEHFDSTLETEKESATSSHFFYTAFRFCFSHLSQRAKF